IVDAYPDLERLDVPLRPTHIALRREPRVDTAIDDHAATLFARRQTHGERVTDAHAIDIRLLDIASNPERVGIDERDDGLPGRHDFAGAYGAHVHDAGDRRANVRVAESDVGLRLLRDGRGALLSGRVELTALHGHLLGCRARHVECGALGRDLLVRRIDAR